jgi:hypothetical protein
VPRVSQEQQKWLEPGFRFFWQPEDNISAAVAITKALTIIQVPWNARVDLLIAVSFIVRPSEFSIA